MKLEGKVTIITGGGGGIGRAVCLAFAREGSDLLIADIVAQKAKAVSEEVQSPGRKAVPFEIDVSVGSQVKEMVKAGLNIFGKIDILVNLMGILRPHAIEDVSEEEWDRVMAVNLKGTFLCCQAVGREMIKKGGGNIINVASLAGHTPQMNAGAYSPSKAGVISLTKLMAVEWAKHNVRVNVLSPGPIRAPMFDFGFNTEALRRKRAKSVPMNRIGRPEEVANAAVFFASDDSSFVTGHAFVIDGGSLSSVYYLTSLLSS